MFNIVADMLAVLIGRAKENGQVGGPVSHLVEGGVSILQYADDTIIFMEHDLAKAQNMKLVLCLFEQLSGLNINFNLVTQNPGLCERIVRTFLLNRNFKSSRKLINQGSLKRFVSIIYPTAFSGAGRTNLIKVAQVH